MLLTVLPVVLLAIVTAWFFWPTVVDPISRVMARRSESEADRVADHLFRSWSKHGRGTLLMLQAERH